MLIQPKRLQKVLKTLSLLAMTSLTILTIMNPAHAELKLTRKTFSEKQTSKLSKAEAKLERTQAKIICIKQAENKKDLKKCSRKGKKTAKA